MASFSKTQRGLTLIEWLVVFAIIALISLVFFSYFNPLRERDRASDSRKKSDLDRIQIALEDYYGDNDCYPTTLPCGGETDPGFRPYLGTVPCDPETGQAYSYYPEKTTCPSYYKIYTNLRWKDDPIIAQLGCTKWGCGPDGGYDYGVSSPNVRIEGWTCPGTPDNPMGKWFACQANFQGNCDCNEIEFESVVIPCCLFPGQKQGPYCFQTWPIDQCYCNDKDCGGRVNKPM